ncbi:MAG: hypothetical protein WCQ16_04450 [Verrucomicrobiae bacterium]
MKKSSALLLAAAFLVTAVALFYAWTNWSGARELRNALAQLEKKKESIHIEDFVPPPVPDDQNVAAAPIFRELFVSEKDSRLGKLIQPWKGTSSPVAGEKRLLQIAKQIDPAFSGDEASAARVVLDSLSPSDLVLAELSEAVRRPQVSWPLEYSKGFEMTLPHIGPMIKASKMLQARALAELAAGAPQKAFEDANTLLAMAEVSASPHLLISELVRISILSMALEVLDDGLCRGAWSDSNLAGFSKSLAQKNLIVQMADALRWERAGAQQMDWSDLKMLAILRTGEKATWTEHITGIGRRIRPAGWVNRARALHLLLMQRMIEAFGDGSRVSPAEIRSIESPCKNVSLWGRLTTPIAYIMLPAIDGAAQNVALTQTLLESTRTACAVERYRLANNHLPPNLNDLVPVFLAGLPKDPITGAPLFYKPSPEGSFVIYGTGWNQTDDGGAVNSPQIDRPQKQADWGVSVSKR